MEVTKLILNLVFHTNYFKLLTLKQGAEDL